MEVAALVFLSSGLFLGWSLGANDAANVFGTAVGTRMVQFTTAAIVCSVFVILGAIISGGGVAHTLGKLGAVNEISGAFMVALSAAVTVYLMTKSGLPVSTTQAIVGAIVGWNLYSGSLTDTRTLITLVVTWVLCPVLAAVIAALLFKLVAVLMRGAKLHLLRIDAYIRTGLILAGAFGAYSLGANNIANVMGVFVPVSPFTAFNVGGIMTISSTQQLFLLGGVAIAVGVFTYSKGVMMTVGRSLLPMSPVAAFVVVLAHSIVLFLFASQSLEHALASVGLPTIPLVPVSSSQAVIGAVVGIGLLQGGRGIRYHLLGGIASGWAMTPFIAGVLCFVALFFLQNVFNQPVYRPVGYELTDAVLGRIEAEGVEVSGFLGLRNQKFESTADFTSALDQRIDISGDDLGVVVKFAEIDSIVVDASRFADIGDALLTSDQHAALVRVVGRRYPHSWMFDEALAELSPEWRSLPDTAFNRMDNRALRETQRVLHALFRDKEEAG